MQTNNSNRSVRVDMLRTMAHRILAREASRYFRTGEYNRLLVRAAMLALESVGSVRR